MDGIQGPIFHLKVFGGFQLRRANMPVGLPSRKLVCLLTYLAFTAPIPQPREKLATLLWGSGSDERARHNLRQAISRLRHVLGQDVILSDGEAVVLAEGAFTCDAATFDRLTRGNARNAAAEAAGLYDGALLENIYVEEVAWNDWLTVERERLSERAIGAMVDHGTQQLAGGRAADAFRVGQRAVALNRFREEAHRLVIRALAATGRTSEAIKHFQDLTTYLKAELHSAPDEETHLITAALGDKGAAMSSNDPAGTARPVRSQSAADTTSPLPVGGPASVVDWLLHDEYHAPRNPHLSRSVELAFTANGCTAERQWSSCPHNSAE